MCAQKFRAIHQIVVKMYQSLTKRRTDRQTDIVVPGEKPLSWLKTQIDETMEFVNCGLLLLLWSFSLFAGV